VPASTLKIKGHRELQAGVYGAGYEKDGHMEKRTSPEGASSLPKQENPNQVGKTKYSQGTWRSVGGGIPRLKAL